MERRDMLRALAATSAALALDGGIEAQTSEALTDADVDLMIRMLAGVAPPPGQVAAVREMFIGMRFKGPVDPSVQPSLVFDPEVDVE